MVYKLTIDLTLVYKLSIDLTLVYKLTIDLTLVYKVTIDLKGNFTIFYMLAKYVPGDIKYIFTKFYRHISTNNKANRKFVILISQPGCDVLN